MGLGTKDVNANVGGNTPKTITPGLQNLKLNNLELLRFPFMEKDDAYYLVLNVETAPIEGFEGFFIDPKDESMGRYEGQVGRVKENSWYYKDFTTKKGDLVERDVQILGAIKRVCEAFGGKSIEWFEKADGKYDTIEEFVEGFNSDAPFADQYVDILVAGKDFLRNNGHTGVDLFLPKAKRGEVTMKGKNSVSDGTLMEFDKADHWEKLIPEASQDFEDDDDDMPFNEAEEIDDELEL